MVVIERIEDAAGFETLREEWNDLLQASASDNLFLTWEWLYTWWKYLSDGRRLYLITVRSGGELAAIAPLAIRPCRLSHLLPFRSLEFLGAGSAGADYLDLIIRRGSERQALQVLAEQLAGGKLMLNLTNVKRKSCLAAQLAVELRQRGWRLLDAKVNVCPLVNLSGHSWQSYLATLGPRHRYNFRRRLKNLSKNFAVRFEQVLTEEQRREALALLVALHNLRWQERGGSDAFHTPGLRSFHEELTRLALQRGWLRLFVLRLDGRPAAGLYGFRYRRTFYFYQSGFDPGYGKQSVGLVTMGLALKNAIEDGAEEYNLLYGDEQYKFHWAHEAHELGRLELYPPGMSGLLHERTAGLHRAIRRVARRVLPQAIVDWIASGKRTGDGRGLYAARPH